MHKARNNEKEKRKEGKERMRYAMHPEQSDKKKNVVVPVEVRNYSPLELTKVGDSVAFRPSSSRRARMDGELENRTTPGE